MSINKILRQIFLVNGLPLQEFTQKGTKPGINPQKHHNKQQMYVPVPGIYSI